mgnify:CR=1 FL=1
MGPIIVGGLALGFGLALIGLVLYFGLSLLTAVLSPINRAMHRLFDRIEAKYPALKQGDAKSSRPNSSIPGPPPGDGPR